MNIFRKLSWQIDGAHGIQVEADELFEKAFFDDAELLVLPGGNGLWPQ